MPARCSEEPGCTIVDAHVHVHDCFSLEDLLDAAAGNFRGAARSLGIGHPWRGLLLLSETAAADCFGRLVTRLRAEGGSPAIGAWRLTPTEEAVSLRLAREDGAELFLVAGRQIVTAEKLEVLALATDRRIPDEAPIRNTLATVAEAGAIPVLPWGFGKWLGRRGRIIADLLDEPGPHGFYLGDNSGRLGLLPAPGEFRVAREAGIEVLPGTDPFPFHGQEGRVGRYGFAIPAAVSGDTPAADLRALLGAHRPLPYGDRENPISFVANQVRMQLAKRRAAGGGR